jgi:hypothetical protein
MVERSNPKRAAAPLGPVRTQLVCFRVFGMRLRSSSIATKAEPLRKRPDRDPRYAAVLRKLNLPA